MVIGVPSLARAWFDDDCPPKLRHNLLYLTARIITPAVVAAECEAITACTNKPEGLVVRSHSAAREVAAKFIIDEIAMDVVIVLPEHYPFGRIQVTGTMDVMSAKQRNWNLQMQTFLMCQNGSIIDALLRWVC